MKIFNAIVGGWCGCRRWCVENWCRCLVMLVSVLCVMGSSRAHAQGVGITAVNFRQYLASAPTPVVAPFTIPVASMVCNQPKPVTTLHSASWDDPDNAGKACVYVDPGTGPLFARVYGALEGTLTNVAGTIESVESARAPFLRPPSAPLNPKVIQ